MKKLTAEVIFGIIEIIIVVATEVKKAYTKGHSAKDENSHSENPTTK